MNNIIFSVCMLFQVSGTKVNGTATGFFFQNGDKVYLITNRHVVDFSSKDLNAKLFFKLHTDDKDLTKLRQIEIPLVENGKLKWFGYSDPTIDIVAIPIDKTLITDCIVYPLSKDNFPSEKISLSIGDELLAVGYPRGFTDQSNFTPIAKSCKIATPIETPFEGKPMILLDGNLQPGMSGSPIITKPSNTQFIKRGISVSDKEIFYLIGIHSSTFYKNIGVKKEPNYALVNGQIQITGFTEEPINENLGLQSCWFNGLIQGLVEKIK